MASYVYEWASRANNTVHLAFIRSDGLVMSGLSARLDADVPSKGRRRRTGWLARGIGARHAGRPAVTRNANEDDTCRCVREARPLRRLIAATTDAARTPSRVTAHSCAFVRVRARKHAPACNSQLRRRISQHCDWTKRIYCTIYIRSIKSLPVMTSPCRRGVYDHGKLSKCLASRVYNY